VVSMPIGAIILFFLGAQGLSIYREYGDTEDLWISFLCFFTAVGLSISLVFFLHLLRLYLPIK